MLHCLQQFLLELLRGFYQWRQIRELADDTASLFQRIRAFRAACRKMLLEHHALRCIKRAQSVPLNQLAKLGVFAHDATFSSSFKRSNPLRIQLFTVPSGSFKACAISEWLSPPK